MYTHIVLYISVDAPRSRLPTCLPRPLADSHGRVPQHARNNMYTQHMI